MGQWCYSSRILELVVILELSESDILAREGMLMANVDPTNSFSSMPNIKFNSSSIFIFLFFHFYRNQTSSTNYGVIVSAPNGALLSLVPRSKRSFCSLIGSFDGQCFLCLTKEILFDLVKKIITTTTRKQTNKKSNTFWSKTRYSVRTIGGVPWVPRHQFQKERQSAQRLKRPRG